MTVPATKSSCEHQRLAWSTLLLAIERRNETNKIRWLNAWIYIEHVTSRIMTPVVDQEISPSPLDEFAIEAIAHRDLHHHQV